MRSSPFTLLGYNRLRIPQFSLEEVASAELIFNGGLGIGDPNSYFCSGKDEANEFRRLSLKYEQDSDWNPNTGFGNYGHYQVVRLIDRCRTEGFCGDLIPDHNSFLIGMPLHATNCHPLGKRKVWDSTGWTGLHQRTAPAWGGRNYIDDGHHFAFGRYLFTQLSEDLSGAALRTALVDDLAVTFTSGDLYNLEAIRPNFLDLPHSQAHLKWGFTCAQASRGYRNRPYLFPEDRRIIGVRQAEAERGDHYHTLLRYAVNRLAHQITHGEFGVVSPRGDGNLVKGLTTSERQMHETVVNIWRILDEMIGRVVWVPCEGNGCWILAIWEEIFGEKIRIKRCQVAPGTIVDYQHDNHRICIESDVFNDCHSKRTNNSHPFYNTASYIEGAHCPISYGERVDNGLYIRNWEVDRGYQLRDVGSHMGAIRGLSGYRPADGNSPVPVSLIAHQLIHAYYQEKLAQNRMAGWPNTPESLWEEELAVTAQAIVFDLLRQMTYVDSVYNMSRETFVRSIERATPGDTSSGVIAATTGERYFYPDSCQGYEGIYLCPLFVNMRNIYAVLAQERNPELARLMALFHSLAPLLELPPQITENGVVRDIRESRRGDRPRGTKGGGTTGEPPRWAYASSDLEVTIGTDPLRIRVGGSATDQVRVRNRGPDPMPIVDLSITIPGGVTYLSASLSQGECTYFEAVDRLDCTLGRLENNQEVSLDLSLQGVSDGNYTAAARASGSITDSDPSNDEREFQIEVGPPSADMEVSVDASPPTLSVGGTITYSLTIRNHGPEGIEESSLIIATTTGNSTFQSGSTAVGPCANNDETMRTVACPIGTLERDGMVSLTVSFRADAAGPLIQKFSIQGDYTDPNLANSIIYHTVEVQP